MVMITCIINHLPRPGFRCKSCVGTLMLELNDSPGGQVRKPLKDNYLISIKNKKNNTTNKEDRNGKHIHIRETEKKKKEKKKSKLKWIAKKKNKKRKSQG